MFLIASSCGKDDILAPSGFERNWLVVENNSSDPIDQLRYQIFKDTGIPIYYNDTLGSYQRLGYDGKYHTEYEVLKAFYTPGSQKPIEGNANYDLAKDKNAYIPFVEYLRDEIIPMVPKSLYVASFLLVDTLVSPSGTLAHKGFNTITVGGIEEFSTMETGTKKLLKGAVLRSMVYGSLMNREALWLEEVFYNLSYKTNPYSTLGIYSTGVGPLEKRIVRKAWEKYVPAKPVAEQKLAPLGFLVPLTPPRPGLAETEWDTPTKEKDVISYCEAIFTYSTAELNAKYTEPVILAKFKALREKLEEYGFIFR